MVHHGSLGGTTCSGETRKQRSRPAFVKKFLETLPLLERIFLFFFLLSEIHRVESFARRSGWEETRPSTIVGVRQEQNKKDDGQTIISTNTILKTSTAQHHHQYDIAIAPPSGIPACDANGLPENNFEFRPSLSSPLSGCGSCHWW